MHLVVAPHKASIRRDKIRRIVLVVSTRNSRVSIDTDIPHNDRRISPHRASPDIACETRRSLSRKSFGASGHTIMSVGRGTLVDRPRLLE
jgi:hypothetical protein